MLCRNFAIASIVFGLSTIAAPVAAAPVQRTFVASHGATANTAFNCSVANPCRAFSEALSVTKSGGEIIVLDSAGYGAVAVTQSVTITAPPGVYAGISVATGDGITITGPSIQVTLRGLTINGQGGVNGITVFSANRLIVDRCTITNMTGNGIGVSHAAATLTNIHIEGGQVGIEMGDNAVVSVADSQLSGVQSAGIEVYPKHAGNPANAHIARTILDKCYYAISVNGFFSQAVVSVTASQIVQNSNVGIGASDDALVYVSDSHISRNENYGIRQSFNSQFVLSNNIISLNGLFGVVVDDPGHVYTMKNNTIHDNPGNITGGPLTPLSLD